MSGEMVGRLQLNLRNFVEDVNAHLAGISVTPGKFSRTIDIGHGKSVLVERLVSENEPASQSLIVRVNAGVGPFAHRIVVLLLASGAVGASRPQRLQRNRRDSKYPYRVKFDNLAPDMECFIQLSIQGPK